jgi:hypothetical protein
MAGLRVDLGMAVVCALAVGLGCSSSDGGATPPGTGGSGGSAGSGATGGSASGSGGGSAADAGSAGAGGSAGQLSEFHLEFAQPAEGQLFTQSGVPATSTINFEVLAGPGISRVEYVIETDFVLGSSTTPPGFALDYVYQYPGNRWTRGLGFDAAGAQVAESLVNFVIEAPAATGCIEQLDQLGVEYSPTVAKGVVDGVKLTGPLNGVLYAKSNTDEPSGDPMACEFVLTLYKFAELLKSRGFVQIGGLGSYCYRCCCSWSEQNYCRGPNDPEPDCSQPPYSGFSNHSWGRALDIRYLYKQSGQVYDVNNPAHWVESSATTCTTALAQQTGISKELYSLVCDSSAQQIFGVVLTPNYNSAHRNHFHADIGKSGIPGTWQVLQSQMPTVDETDLPDE